MIIVVFQNVTEIPDDRRRQVARIAATFSLQTNMLPGFC
jgi:hypothetical protein